MEPNEFIHRTIVCPTKRQLFRIVLAGDDVYYTGDVDDPWHRWPMMAKLYRIWELPRRIPGPDGQDWELRANGSGDPEYWGLASQVTEADTEEVGFYEVKSWEDYGT